MKAQWHSGRVLDSRPKGRRFEPHKRHYIVSLSKTHLSLLSSGSTQEDPSRHNLKIVDWDVKNQIKQKSNSLFFRFDAHERQVGELARELGFTQVSLSSEVMPMVRIVPRGYTGMEIGD